MKIPVVRSILEANDQLSQELQNRFDQLGILTLNLMSSPGAGKTTLLEKTLKDLKDEFCMAVIEGDIQTDNDAQRIAATGAQCLQINTAGGCHLDCSMIQKALDQLDISKVDILFIENVGNLVCPAEFNLGEDYKITILSVTEGDDKPEKYPLMFAESKLVLINKTDLLPYVNFNLERASRFAQNLNKDLEVYPISCQNGEGLSAWYTWLQKAVSAKKK